MCSPACAIAASSPAVFSATVLPPVFGPVITSTCTGGWSTMSTGTTDGVLNSGCRAPRSSKAPSVDITGSMPPTDMREARPRLDDIELGGDVDRPAQVVRASAERVGQREQDAADFLGLLLLERDDVVVDLDGVERLEIQAGAAGGGAVDDAGNR